MPTQFVMTVTLPEGATGDIVADALVVAAGKFRTQYAGFDLTSGDPFNGSVSGVDARWTVEASEAVALSVLAANLVGGMDDATASDAALRYAEFGADRVRIMLRDAVRVARGESGR